MGGVGASHIEIPRDFPSQLRRQESNQGITIPPATQARLSYTNMLECDIFTYAIHMFCQEPIK